jgi:hypothetical protein
MTQDFALVVANYANHQSTHRLEVGMAMIRDAPLNLALTPLERRKLREALDAADRLEASLR